MRNASTVTHHTPGRTRITLKVLPTQAQVGEIKKALESIESISQVRPNNMTGSFLIFHETELPKLIESIRQLGVLEEITIQETEAVPDVFTQLRKAMARTNESARQVSKNSGDLKSAVVLGLCVLGLYQVFRGKPLASASSLFADAFKISLD